MKNRDFCYYHYEAEQREWWLQFEEIELYAQALECILLSSPSNALQIVSGVGLRGYFSSATLSRLDQLRVLSLENNSLFGPVPDLSPLVNLKSLFLSRNEFNGAFPPSILSLHRLMILSLSHNNFTGQIPSGITALDRLTSLNLEFNRFNGTLPSLNQSFLTSFNVSFNNLTGVIPATPTLSRFEASSFRSNPGLCGEVINRACASSRSPFFGSSNKTTSSSSSSQAPLGQSAQAQNGGAVVISPVVSKKKAPWRSFSFEPQSRVPNSGNLNFCGGGGGGEGGESSQGMYTLEQLMRASAELLGRGSVGITYKAVFDNQLIVTVKRLDAVKTAVTSEEAFENHMEIVGGLRHQNLVPIRAYFQSNGERLIIYDYQPNGSLFNLIHGTFIFFKTGTIGLLPKETWHHIIGRWKRRRDGGFGSFAFGKLKSKIEKGELDGDELKHRIEDRSFPNESDDLISSLHLRLLSSTGVSIGVSLQIERSQLPIERSQLRNLNPLPFDSDPVRKLLSSPNPRRIVPILARYGLQLLDEMDRF
ncbi:hypothetical protein YC2023_077347 [Brassica napus]